MPYQLNLHSHYTIVCFVCQVFFMRKVPTNSNLLFLYNFCSCGSGCSECRQLYPQCVFFYSGFGFHFWFRLHYTIIYFICQPLFLFFLVHLGGLEPSTLTLKVSYSTNWVTDAYWLLIFSRAINPYRSPTWFRFPHCLHYTIDFRICQVFFWIVFY